MSGLVLSPVLVVPAGAIAATPSPSSKPVPSVVTAPRAAHKPAKRPTVTGITPSSGPVTGGTKVTITGTGFTGATLVQFGAPSDGPPATFSVKSDKKITATSPAESVGDRDVVVTGPGGTSPTSSTDVFTYGPMPVVSKVAPPTGSTRGGTKVHITGSGFTGATTVLFGAPSDGPPATFSVKSDKKIIATSPAESVGDRDVRVSGAGGTSAVTADDVFTYRAKRPAQRAPSVTGVSPSSGPVAGGTTVTISGSGFSGATVVQFGASSDGPPATFSIDSDSQITATSPAEAPGDRDVKVTGPGGTSAVTAADLFTYLARPVVTNVSPAVGPTTGGTMVTVTGSGFTGATSVQVGGSASRFTVDSDTHITATTPAHSAGDADLVVTTPAGSSQTGSGDVFTYVAQPAITGVAPSGGPSAGGTTVTISGTGFHGATAVWFGSPSDGAQATFTVDSDTQITTTSPAGPAGTLDVFVVGPGGTTAAGSADRFSYIAAPVVSGIKPSVGPTAGGTTVTITGVGFTGASAVQFGRSDDHAPVAFTVDSDTQITATSPAAAAGSSNVRVTGPGGTSDAVSSDVFTYIAGPVVTGISPSSGPAVGGTTVTITGSGFTAATAVQFGTPSDGPPATFTVNSDTKITATSPAEAAGVRDVRVIGPGGTSGVVPEDVFSYYSAVTDSVSGVTITDTTPTSVTLSWTNPTNNGFTGVMIRRTNGNTPPTGPTDGVTVADLKATTFVDTNLAPGATYSYALFAHDATPAYAPGVNKSHAVPTTTGVAQFCGTISSDQTWDPSYAASYKFTCIVSVPANVTLTMQPGTTVDSTSGGLTVFGTVDAEGTGSAPVSMSKASSTWMLTVRAGGDVELNGAALTRAALSDSGESGQTVTLANSTLSNGLVSLTHVGAFTASDSAFNANGVTLGVAGSASSISVTGNTFTASALGIGSGAPIVQGNSWANKAHPLTVFNATDLAGVSGNTFSGGGLAQVATFNGQVTHAWTVDGTGSGQITEFFNVTVASSGQLTIPSGAQVKVQQLTINGSVVATDAGPNPVPPLLVTDCDNTIGGNTWNCESNSSPENISVGAGGVLRTENADVRHLNLTTGGSNQTLGLSNSSFLGGVISCSSCASVSVTGNTFTGSTVDTSGGAPFIQRNSWAGVAFPLDVFNATDLSGVYGNSLAGGGLDQVARFSGHVSGDWTMDGAGSGQISLLNTVTVDIGGSMTIPSGGQVKVGQVYVSGTLTATDGGTQPGVRPLLDTDCDSGLGGTTTGCPSSTFPSNVELLAGGTFETDHADVSYITVTGNGTGQTLDLAESRIIGGITDVENVAAFAATKDEFDSVQVTVGAVTSSSTITLTDDTFVASTLATYRGAPVLERDTWSGAANPLIVLNATDLSRIFGNAFSGGGLDQVALFQGIVTGPWPLDGGTSGQVADFSNVTVAAGGAITIPSGALVKVQQLTVWGTVDVTDRDVQPAVMPLLTTDCDDGVGGHTWNCASVTDPGSIALEAGSVFQAEDATIRYLIVTGGGGAGQVFSVVDSAVTSSTITCTLFSSVNLSGNTLLTTPTTATGVLHVTVIDNTFTTSPLAISGGAPVVQGNSFLDQDNPLYVAAIDLSGVYDNRFPGDGLEKVATFAGHVAGQWTVDGEGSGQITVLSTVTVDSGGKMTVPSGAQVKVGQVYVSGTVDADDEDQLAPLLTTNCDSSLGGATTNCPTSTTLSNLELRAGGALQTEGADIRYLYVSATGSGQTIDIGCSDASCSAISNSVIEIPAVASFTADGDGGMAVSADESEPCESPNELSDDSVTVGVATPASPVTVRCNQFEGSSIAINGGAPGVQANSWAGKANPLTVLNATDLSKIFFNTYRGGGLDQVATFNGHVMGTWQIDGGDSGLIAYLSNVSIEADASVVVPDGGVVKILEMSVAGSFTATQGETPTGSPPHLVTACDSSVGGVTFNCSDPHSPGSVRLSAGASFVTSRATVDYLRIMSVSGETGQSVSLHSSTFSGGSVQLTGAGFIASENTFTNDSVSLSESRALTVEDNTWTDSPYPFTAVSADDLGGVAANNYAAGSDSPLDATFTLSGVVLTTLTLASDSQAVYSLGAVTVDGELDTDPHAEISGGNITIDGVAKIGTSTWVGAGFSVSGSLAISDADFESTPISANPGARVRVVSTHFSDNQRDIIGDTDCTAGPTSVSVSSSTFSGGISYCNTELYSYDKLDAVGNEGLTIANVTTHYDMCIWEDPEVTGPRGDEYTLEPIYDVNIGPRDAGGGFCDPGYLKVVEGIV